MQTIDVFQEIPGSIAILRCKGLYKQTELYYRGKYVYAKYGSGFIRLFPQGGTSLPSVSWKDMDSAGALLTNTPLAVTYQAAAPEELSKPALAVLTA